jgi:hypothetical protein
VTLALKVQNHGLYPSQVSLVGEPISGFSVTAISSTVNHTATNAGEGTRITLQFGQQANESGIPRNGQATITVTYRIASDALLGPRVARFRSEASGLEAWPGDEQIAVKISVLKESIWLPMLSREPGT